MSTSRGASTLQMVKVRGLQCESVIALTILASTTVLPSDTTFIDARRLAVYQYSCKQLQPLDFKSSKLVILMLLERNM
jgi:hypothetical protein